MSLQAELTEVEIRKMIQDAFTTAGEALFKRICGEEVEELEEGVEFEEVIEREEEEAPHPDVLNHLALTTKELPTFSKSSFIYLGPYLGSDCGVVFDGGDRTLQGLRVVISDRFGPMVAVLNDALVKPARGESTIQWEYKWMAAIEVYRRLNMLIYSLDAIVDGNKSLVALNCYEGFEENYEVLDGAVYLGPYRNIKGNYFDLWGSVEENQVGFIDPLFCSLTVYSAEESPVCVADKDLDTFLEATRRLYQLPEGGGE